MNLVRRRWCGALLVAAMLSGGWLRLAAVPAAKPVPQPPAAAAPAAIAGLALPRPNGGFLGLQLVANRFVLSFYDAKKVLAPVDVASATVRWQVKYQPADERALLTPGADGTSLTSEKNVRPPHHFHLFLALFVAGSEDAVETHAVDFDG